MVDKAIELKNVNAWYGESHILHKVDLCVHSGEVVALLGRNGAGRTTVLRSIFGLVGRRTGTIQINSEDITRLPPHLVARRGVGYCPEERGILASLTCEENLILPREVNTDGMSLTQIYDMFPNLKSRRRSPGGRLSGGEQQMLAVARILRTGARILLLDEISEGLAPVIVRVLRMTLEELKKLGYTILMVEQNFSFAAEVADRFYVMESGYVIREFDKDNLDENRGYLRTHLSA